MSLKLKLLPAAERIPQPVIPGRLGRRMTRASERMRSPEEESEGEDEDYVDPAEPVTAAITEPVVHPIDPPAGHKATVLTYEPLHFNGTFENVLAPASTLNRSVRGVVKMTLEGQVYWRFIIRYGGEDQWVM